MPAGTTERRLAAILLADVVGYSPLMSEDEQGTIQTLNAYREAIGALVEQHRGRVVDFRGDDLLAEFPNALDAVQCAVEMSARMRTGSQDWKTRRRSSSGGGSATMTSPAQRTRAASTCGVRSDGWKGPR